MARRRRGKQTSAGLGFGAFMLMVESQQVIPLRMAKLAHGGLLASAEAQRMVSEKAAVEQGMRMAGGASAGTLMRALRGKVRANRRRLSRKSA